MYFIVTRHAKTATPRLTKEEARAFLRKCTYALAEMGIRPELNEEEDCLRNSNGDVIAYVTQTPPHWYTQR